LALKAPELDKRIVPEVGWDEFLERFHNLWQPGEHVSAIGRSGSGKTTMITQLLDERRYVVVLLTKRTDPLFPTFRRRGYKPVRNVSEWPERDWHPKIVIHIPTEGLGRREGERQAGEIRRVLDHAWDLGDVDLYIDEIAELADLLGLERELRTFWKEARSAGVSVVAGTQRPARVPLEMYDQPRFLLFWHSSNREAMKRLADMNAGDPELARQVVAQLDRYEVLAIDGYEQELVRTRPPKL
jgi:hypothetical protein